MAAGYQVATADATEEQAQAIFAAAGGGKDKVELDGVEYRIDYSVEFASSVTKGGSVKRRAEYFTCSPCTGKTLSAVKRDEARGKDGGKPELPAPVCEKAPAERKGLCHYWRKGACKGGMDCPFAHHYVPPPPKREKPKCRWLSTEEGCRFGDKCRYSHAQ